MKFATLLFLLFFSFSLTQKLETFAKWNISKFFFQGNNSLFECQNCLPAGIGFYENKTFVSFPRWHEDVPATLALLSYSNDSKHEVIFIPWPSLEDNQIGNATALQSVLGFEILGDYMYVLDQGKINNTAAIQGSIKVSKYNIKTEKLEHIFLFNTTIASLETSFLNDIVINPKNNKAYISDSGCSINETTMEMTPGIIVLDLSYNSGEKITVANAFRINMDKSSLMPEDTFWLTVDGNKVNVDSPMRTGVDGIALSCDYKSLFYTPLSSRVIYSIRVDNLVPNKEVTEINKGYKGFASDGLTYSDSNYLYLTDIENGAIHKVKIVNAKTINEVSFLDPTSSLVPGSNQTMWPDTMMIYKNYLYFMSNQLNYFNSDKIDFLNPRFGDSNFRIYRIAINEENYLVGCEGSSSSFGVVLMWILISVLIMVILAFVLMSSHKQEAGVDKNMAAVGLEQDVVE